MTGQTIILATLHHRQRAHALIDAAPERAVVNIRAATRTISQNDKMWANLSDVSRAKPEGRKHTTEVWKALAMDMAGCKPQWERSLDGESIVCVGYKSSTLTKEKMSEVIEAINCYAATHGVPLSEREMAA